MSTISGVSSSSSDVAYATQLAQTAKLQKSLYNLGSAVQGGDLSSASSILTAVMKANPQFASTGSGAADSSDAVNTDFQSLAQAIGNNDSDGAKTAWGQLTTDLTKQGVSVTDGTAATIPSKSN